MKHGGQCVMTTGDATDASVVCKQLGYSRFSKYRNLLPRIKIAENPTTIIGSHCVHLGLLWPRK